MPRWAIPRDKPNYAGRLGVPSPQPLPPASGVPITPVTPAIPPDPPASDAPVEPPKIAVQEGMTDPTLADIAEAVEVAGDVASALGLGPPAPNFRAGAGITNRDEQIMSWRLPNGSSVQMYINPENFQVAESKQVTPTRTKGGFVVQYWGENLTKLTLSGTTGSAGIKGIQVLRDIYRSENIGFELVAATQMSSILAHVQSNAANLEDASLSSIFSSFSEELRNSNFTMRPSLAALSLSILLFYQGVMYRGFFTEFSVTESTAKLGLFDYNIAFTVTETRGTRKNFMAWHREPLGDDMAGQLISGALNEVGNAVSGALGLPQSSQNPQQFHPENSPLTFGGTSLSGLFNPT